LYEIVVVCESCPETLQAVNDLASDNIKVHYYEENMGKSYAIKYGAFQATGDLVTFMDADLSIDPREIDRFIKLMDTYDADIVIGSKRHPQSKVSYPLFRRLQSFLYQVLVTALFRVNVKDTQTGLKLFKREVLQKIIPRVLVKAYAFDLELLVVANLLGYDNVLEAPVEINERFNKVADPRSTWRVLRDTLAIFYRLKVLKYYDRDHMFIEMSGPELCVSIIVPVKKINDYVRESVRYLEEMSYDNYEAIIFSDEDTKPADFPENVRVVSTGDIGPAEKRDLSLEYATGDILAFLDDDAYPSKDWLINAVKHFHDDGIAAVCGPAVTPKTDSVLQRASGAVYESRLGSGSLIFRYTPRRPRETDDYPTVNLLVRTDIFSKVGGFDSSFWPGEDTKLCMDMINLDKKIIYDPDILVWHHRRKLFIPHLKQIANYALHRGYFAKKYPKTSRRPAYFLPSLFVIGLIGGPAAGMIGGGWFVIYAIVEGFYLLTLIAAASWATLMTGSLSIGLLVIPGVMATHLTYGAFFIKGLLIRRLVR
jgi:glycosyltransferase involved in cell wall biosynthesis